MATGQDQTRKIGISIDEAADMVGCSASLLYVIARRGGLAGCRRLGKGFIIHRETFEAWWRAGHGDDLDDRGNGG